MLPTKAHILSLVLGAAIFAVPSTHASGLKPKSVVIPAGKFFPQYGPGGSKKEVEVRAFRMDVVPVTAAAFMDLLASDSKWVPGAPTALMAESNYLSDWKKKGKSYQPDPKKVDHPVVFVSYFAAQAYCELKKGRLPTTLEWEYAAQDDPKTQLEWFTNPRPPTAVGKGKPNRHGVYDLHGQVWEWTADFNSSFATADNRSDGEMNKNLFCGSGSMGARDRENYPAFMRYAMRSGLRPNHVISNLGFRCVYDQE